MLIKLSVFFVYLYLLKLVQVANLKVYASLATAHILFKIIFTGIIIIQKIL